VLRGATTLSIGGRMMEPGVAWGEDRFAVTWFATRGSPYSLQLGHIGLLSSAGELLGPPKPLRGCGDSMIDGCSSAYHSAIAYGRGGWAIAFEHEFLGGVLRTDVDGVAVDKVLLPSLLYGFDMAFDGAGFGVLATTGGRPPTFLRVVFAP
jgi:hypothetical protein